jgi:hypothetical protein
VEEKEQATTVSRASSLMLLRCKPLGLLAAGLARPWPRGGGARDLGAAAADGEEALQG